MSQLFVSIYYYSEDIGNLIGDSHILTSAQFNRFGCDRTGKDNDCIIMTSMGNGLNLTFEIQIPYSSDYWRLLVDAECLRF